MHFYVSHRPSIQHGRPTPSHRPALTLARCSAPADFASLRVLGAPAASRPPLLTSSLVALPASLGPSYRPALRWPGIPGLRSASRCPHPFTPSGLRRLRPVSRTARGLRAPRLRRPSVPALRTALAFGGAVFRRCGRLLGVSSRLQPLRGLRLRTALRSVCSPLQPFGPSDARKLACGSPMFPQFAIVALLRYRLQASCLFRPHWTSASPVPRTARGEAPSHRVRASCAPLARSWGF